MSVLKVKFLGKNKLSVSYPADHPKANDIKRWLTYLSAGYTEFLIRFGYDPHCDACRDSECENCGNGDDACSGFKYGDKW
jgi:hypothetical protein